MKIAPVSFNFNSTPNFKGIIRYAGYDSETDRQYETIVNTYTYNYWPFKSEGIEEINKVRQQYENHEYIVDKDRRQTFYDVEEKTVVDVKQPLPFTKAQYEALKEKGLTDDFILETFA